MSHPEPGAPVCVEPARPGRKRDASRDPEILNATLDVLAEYGYEGTTIDLVAARVKAGKATVYRRWASKEQLVVDAVACMKNAAFTPLPDTGSLRGDLVALIGPHSIEDGKRKLRIMAGLFSMVQTNRELAEAVRVAIVEPRTAATRALLQRAVDRGEIAPVADLDMVSAISTSMASYRMLVLGLQVNREFLISIIDGVILPAVGATTSAPA